MRIKIRNKALTQILRISNHLIRIQILEITEH
jgi:hypothetical protein